MTDPSVKICQGGHEGTLAAARDAHQCNDNVRWTGLSLVSNLGTGSGQVLGSRISDLDSLTQMVMQS